MHDNDALIVMIYVQVVTRKVSIVFEAEVSPEANGKPGVNPVAASTHSKVAGDVHLCFQTRMCDVRHSLAAHHQTVMPCCHTPSLNMLHVRIADRVSSACLVGTFFVNTSHVKKS
jgi:hypothetical protein